MTDRPRPYPGCPPLPVDPAPQPRPPGGGSTCTPIPPTKPPTWEDPKPCPTDTNCKCPEGPSGDPNCLEKLITAKAGEVAAAEKTKAFKTELEALLAKAKTATQDYTREKYEKLRKEWIEQDAAIAELIRKLVCAVPCWRCVIECHVCPLLNVMHQAEQRLAWDPVLYPKAYNLYDLLSWHTRDREIKEWRLNRIKAVLTAWEKPASTIEKALADNAKIIADAGKAIGSEPTKVIVDVFLRLASLHLAIAPPQGQKWPTKIDKEYVTFCDCDVSLPDDCCGPDVGQPSLRQRLIGPQPYLIDPSAYIDLICCLVDKRYRDAQQAFADADGEVLKAEGEIKRNKALVENGLKNFDKDAKAAIPSLIDCCDYDPDYKPPTSSQAS